MFSGDKSCLYCIPVFSSLIPNLKLVIKTQTLTGSYEANCEAMRGVGTWDLQSLILMHLDRVIKAALLLLGLALG